MKDKSSKNSKKKKENIDLGKREFLKKGVLGLVGLGGIAAFSKLTKAGIFFRDGTYQSTASGGGAWNLIGTAVASNSASLTITGLDSTYETYAIGLTNLLPATNSVYAWLRFGDSGGVDSGGTDYAYHLRTQTPSSATPESVVSLGASQLVISNSDIGNVNGEGYSASFFLRPGSATTLPQIGGSWAAQTQATVPTGGYLTGFRDAVITLDRVQFLFSSGNIASGRMTVWGISHA